MRSVLWQLDSAATAGTRDMIPERDGIDPRHQWSVESLYPDDAAWETDFARIESLARPIEAMRGKLDSAEAVFRLLEAETRLDLLVDRLYTYAHLRADEDTANNDGQARQLRIRARITEISGRLAWIQPEILSHSEETLRQWADSNALKNDRYAMVKLIRRKPHTLSDKEETLLSRAGEVFAAPNQTFNFLTNADMRFPTVTDSEGRERELSQGRYITFLLDQDRRVRRDAFNAMYDTYSGFRNTLACTLSANIKLHNYMAETRQFPSALEASLHNDHIPPDLYATLIEATHDALPFFHKYVSLRKRRLALDDLNMWDMYVPIVPEYEIKVPFEQARQWAIEACRPLGEEYVGILKSSFADRWIDIYENRGKRSGAYSSGCYDSLPYVLLNYQGTLDDVFTLVHELGHSMHSWLANHSQPPRYAAYPIFIAEIASTTHEALLLRYLLKKTFDSSTGVSEEDSLRFRACLLNHLCDAYKGTVFRQTMFAEFEKLVHEMDAEDQPLTPDALAAEYYRMNAEYYGPEIDADERIALEWSRIPHFYYNFYVYKYATSFCASQIFVRRILENEKQRDQYLNLLRAGGSADPLDLVKAAGVDLTGRATLESAFTAFDETVRELDKALASLR